MKVFILHHHLNTGGVTKVIDVQINALKTAGLTVELIVGSNDDLKRKDLPVHIIKELQYLEPDQKKDKLQEDLSTINKTLIDFHHANPDSIFHCHNLCLGKNPLLNLAIEELLAHGAKILNHCHDFAEDDRPHLITLLDKTLSLFDKKREELLYPPTTSKLRFATINSLDRDRLIRKGISPTHILDLPNAIGEVPALNKAEMKKKIRAHFKLDERLIFLYPVRVIRRKNIGEFILLAYLLKDHAQFLVTQPPKNPEEIIAYDHWLNFCKDHEEIPVHFEVGQKANFDELMSAADAVITTSVQEGFGLGFLEPWLYETTVVGRDLPEITKDFKKIGLTFPQLYSSLNVDGEDFSKLSISDQQTFIKKCILNSDYAKEYSQTFPLKKLISSMTSDIISQNKKLIQQNYSSSAYGKKLANFYVTSF